MQKENDLKWLWKWLLDYGIWILFPLLFSSLLYEAIIKQPIQASSVEIREDIPESQRTEQSEVIQESENTDEPAILSGATTEEVDSRVEEIRSYLTTYKSPLVDYSEEFVKAADEYGIDYRLVVAISIIESSGGKINFRPYNAWGWGKNGFNNWIDGIWSVSKGLANGYYAKGLTTPETIVPAIS